MRLNNKNIIQKSNVKHIFMVSYSYKLKIFLIFIRFWKLKEERKEEL